MIRRTTSEVIKDMRTKLLGLNQRVYYHEAPESKTYPYIVFDVRPMGENMMTVELDLWSMRPDQIAILDLATRIEESFDNFIFNGPLYTMALVTNNDTQWLVDEDKDILHMNLSFTGVYQA